MPSLPTLAQTPERHPAPRRALGPKQASTVERLLTAVQAELALHPYDVVTMRTITKTAGVSVATGYAYFTSKDHLVAELLWRRYQAVSDPAEQEGTTTIDRVVAVLSNFALLVADEPNLAHACSMAVLANDPDVHLLRDLIGAETRRRLELAGRGAVSPEMLTTLEHVVSGALIRAGTGHVSYHELPEHLRTAAVLICKGVR